MTDKITINLKGLPVDERKQLIRLLTYAQKIASNDTNKLALLLTKEFDTGVTPGYLSDMESM